MLYVVRQLLVYTLCSLSTCLMEIFLSPFLFPWHHSKVMPDTFDYIQMRADMPGQWMCRVKHSCSTNSTLPGGALTWMWVKITVCVVVACWCLHTSTLGSGFMCACVPGSARSFELIVRFRLPTALRCRKPWRRIKYSLYIPLTWPRITNLFSFNC